MIIFWWFNFRLFFVKCFYFRFSFLKILCFLKFFPTVAIDSQWPLNQRVVLVIPLSGDYSILATSANWRLMFILHFPLCIGLSPYYRPSIAEIYIKFWVVWRNLYVQNIRPFKTLFGFFRGIRPWKSSACKI